MVFRLKALERYLRPRIVFCIDTFVSVMASAGVLLILFLFEKGLLPGARFSLLWLAVSAVSSALAFIITKVYRIVIRHSTLHDLAKVLGAVLLKEALLFVGAGAVGSTSGCSWGTVALCVLLDLFLTLGVLVIVRILMLMTYRYVVMRRNEDQKTRVLIYGDSDKSLGAAQRLRNSTHYKVLGFITPGLGKTGMLQGLPLYRFRTVHDLEELKKKLRAEGLLFAYMDDVHAEKDRLFEFARQASMKLFVAPSINEYSERGSFTQAIRKIHIEDLLGRSEIHISMDEIRRNFEGKTVLVTGAAGSIGSELCRQLAAIGVGKLVMFDNAETPLHNVRLEFEDHWPDLKFVPVIGDVRNPQRLDYVFRSHHPQVVFHAAAYKHVPLMEENPCEAVLANVAGSRNVADKCVEYDVEKMVMVSTDKAVNPTNIMGCTKRLAEIYVQALGLAIEHGKKPGKTTFVTTRFGNVLGSNGSVIPRFKEQIERGGPVTVTDPEIRRFFMTIPEACRLVMEAATMATGTQIFVFDMGKPIKIATLAERMITLAGFRVGKDIKIEYTGLRPGEKLYEEVLATKENTIPTDHDRIFVAKVRDYDYEEAAAEVDNLECLASSVDIPEMVKDMKRIVPEFISKHSVFEKYDRRPDADNKK
ncbi:MAG: polysaccharide biosynthesis protein [Muribaculaceae bacterium]|nr:polysaccharide biosynthesis protein [Muribaculaceae bacterium]